MVGSGHRVSDVLYGCGLVADVRSYTIGAVCVAHRQVEAGRTAARDALEKHGYARVWRRIARVDGVRWALLTPRSA